MGLRAKKRKSGFLLVLGWVVVAALVVVTLVTVKEPPRHQYPGQHAPRAFVPRATIEGSHQPPAPRETPSAEQLDVAALQAAADYAEQQSSRALVVTRHGYIVFEKYWQGSNLDTEIESPGLGRVVAALATGAAISAHKIGWPDEPLGYLLPAWSKDPRGEITVRHLLQLTSGLLTYGPADNPGPYLNRPKVLPPGQSWLMTSADPDLLAYVIQTATGQPYPEFVSQEIWRRIGAGDASIWVVGPNRNPYVDAGFRARQGDWLRVAELLLRNGNYQGDEILDPRWVPQLLQPTKANSEYGSYLRLRAPDLAGAYATNDVFVIEGGANRMWLVPSLQIAILRTGETFGGGGWDESRIPNTIIRGARDYVPPAARPGTDLRQLVPNH